MATVSVSAVPVEGLWTIDEVSAFLQIPTATLYQWRHRRVGPPAFKVGRHLRYDPAAVRAWLASAEV
ncbi:helix-turn-helix domain-containing protein [Actinoplanes xinjiangensis]|uniref:helix-turn-helix domain-containing protein n=1 Tax=Actinoplanes xinjiangensis TaxID=512350 RepID=UPI003446150E